jgi:Ca2+-binding EF-hand superfamily protein
MTMKANKAIMWTVALAIGVGAGITVSTSAGQGTKAAKGQAWLVAMDPDHDGTVSQEELDVYMNAQFKKADVDNDGTLDAKELAQFRKSLMAIGKTQ